MSPGLAGSTRADLESIRAVAGDALAFTAGLDEGGVAALPQADRRTFRALKNALAEIGELVNRLPPDLRARYPEVDWRGWAGLRDVDSFGRFGPELPRLHPAMSEELPVLVAAVTAELARAGAERGNGPAQPQSPDR